MALLDVASYVASKWLGNVGATRNLAGKKPDLAMLARLQLLVGRSHAVIDP